MKLVTRDDVSQYTKTISTAGLKGCALGTVVGIGLTQLLSRKYPPFRNSTYTVKTAVLLFPGLLVGATNMELATLQFENNKYGLRTGSSSEKSKREALQKLSWAQRSYHYVSENKYKIIIGLWAASLGGSFYMINKNKFQTRAQKIVQARVYAQTLTVILLLGSVFFSVSDSPADSREKLASWEQALQDKGISTEKILAHENT